ncbi:hypothetical protein DL769_000477 [Monosporascus sp. CRB-8-3]|nr:hypothetical protein DL769_000477 [Monosporascus sp. CRB-8-3]
MAGLGKVMLDEHARLMIVAGLRAAGFEVVPMSAGIQALRPRIPTVVNSAKRWRPASSCSLISGPTLRGYGSDAARTILPDRASVGEEIMDIGRTAHMAQEAGLSRMRAKETCADVDAVFRVPIEDAGYGAFYTHQLCHGLGVDIHEHLYLDGANKEKLKLGEFATNEPGMA